MQNTDRSKKAVVTAVLALSLWALTMAMSWRRGSFQGQYGSYPDEAAHYVSGLMVHDYLLSGHYRSPLAFAEQFYIHYPKVAIGHWPPLFYSMEALWMIVFSTSRSSVMFFTGTLAALLAFGIYRLLRVEFHNTVALGAAVLFLTLPLVQVQTGLVMTDIAVSLFCLLSATYFGRYLDRERAADVLLFGLFAAAAIMTKGSGFALIFVPAVGILLTRKWRLLARPSFWSCFAIVLGICGPWYWLTRHMNDGTWAQPRPSLAYSIRALGFYGTGSFIVLGWILALLAGIGLARKMFQFFGPHTNAGIWAALVGLLLGALAICCGVPTGTEYRLILPAVPVAIAFAVVGAEYLISRIRFVTTRTAVPLTILLLFTGVTAFRRAPRAGMRIPSIAGLLETRPFVTTPVVLASSDSDGEGVLVSEIAMRDHRPQHIVLRASKVLADESWTGRAYRPLFTTTSGVLNYLRAAHVGLIIFDNSVSPDQDQRLLLNAIGSSAGEWKISATYSVWRGGLDYPNGIATYVAENAKQSGQAAIRIRMHRMLGTSLVLKHDHGARHYE